MNCHRTPFSRGQTSQVPVADLPANQAQGGVADSGSHTANLAISTFVYGELQPAIRYRFTGPHRWVARPQIRGLDGVYLGWPTGAVLESDSLAQFLQFLLPGRTFHLHQIGLGQMKARLADACLQGTVIGEQQQPFRIPVQPPGRVHTGYWHELAQRSAPLVVAELGEDLKRFVK